MKPVHVAILGALLAVAAVVYLVRDDNGSREADRGTTTRDNLRPVRQQRTTRRTDDPRRNTPGVDTSRGELAVVLRLVDPQDEPAAGATWELSGPTTSRGTASGDGGVRVENLAPGFYRLTARQGTALGNRSFALQASTDLGILRLRKSLAIAGHVYDALGKPIGGARVDATYQATHGVGSLGRATRSGIEAPDVAATATTDPSGAYELHVPGADTYGMRVAATGFALAFEPNRPFDRARDDMDFHLVPGETLVGRVWGDNDTPIAGAQVRVSSSVGLETYSMEVHSGTDGRFAVPSHDAGWNRVRVDAVGYAPHSRQVRAPVPPMDIKLTRGVSLRLRAVAADTGSPLSLIGASVQTAAAAVGATSGPDGVLTLHNLPWHKTNMAGALHVGGGDHAPRAIDLSKFSPDNGWIELGDVELAAGGVVTGRITAQDTGAPVADASVRGFGGNWQLLAAAGPQAKSDADGRFELRGLPLDTVTLIATHKEFISTLDIGAALGPSTPKLFAGGTQVRRDIKMVAAQSLHVTVVDPEGNPVAGARITQTRRTRAFSGFLGSRPSSWITDENGRATITRLARGETVPLVASHQAFGNSAEATARAGTLLQVALTQPSAITGTLVTVNEKPVAGAKVSVSRPPVDPRRPGRTSAAARPGVSDAEGRFAIRNAPEGELILRVDHPQFRALKRRVRVKAGALELGEITLERGHFITGVVVDENDTPLANVTVRFSARFEKPIHISWTHDPAEGRAFGSTVTGSDGAFAFYGLHGEARFELHASHQQMFSDRPLIAINTDNVRLRMRHAVTLKGIVRSPAGPVGGAGVNVSLRQEGSDRFVRRGFARTADDGTFTVPRLPPATPMRVEIFHGAFERLLQDSVVASPTAQSFVLAPGTRVAGRVLDDDGTPLALWVFAKQGATVRTVRAKADGSFVAGGFAAAGEITITVQSGGDHIEPPPTVIRPGVQDMVITLEKGLAIAGTVINADNDPVSGLSVTLHGDGNVRQVRILNQTGKFRIGGLRAGAYAISVVDISPDGKTLASLENVAAGTADLRIRVDR